MGSQKELISYVYEQNYEKMYELYSMGITLDKPPLCYRGTNFMYDIISNNYPIELIREVLRMGYCPNEPVINDYHLTFPIDLAIEKNNLELFNELLSNGAELHDCEVSEIEMLPIHNAAIHGCNEIMDKLISLGVNLNSIYGKDYMSPLHLASQKGHIGIIRKLLAADAKPYLCDYYGDKAIHLAVQNGHTEVVSAFLDRGIHPNTRGFQKNTPLHYTNGNMEMIQLLISRGANQNLRNQFGIRAITD